MRAVLFASLSKVSCGTYRSLKRESTMASEVPFMTTRAVRIAVEELLSEALAKELSTVASTPA